MSERKRQVPPLLVEQLALGELDEAGAAKVRRELDGDDALERIDASNREILADHPPERVAAEIQRRLGRAEESRTPSRAWIPWVAAPVMAAAVALVWVVVRDDDDTTLAVNTEITDGEREQTRLKGDVEPHLVIDRRTPAGHERLAPDQVVASGDLLQVSYVPAGRRHGVIVSLDGAGAVTLHHPENAGARPTLAEGSEVPLAHSYELDDAPGFERFVFVTRDGEPPTVDEVMRAAEKLAGDPGQARMAPLELAGAGWKQSSLLLRKASSTAEGGPSPGTPAGDSAQTEAGL
jgi:hypothetical protein